jgi:vesicle transport through interaction with t-SNAREs protein 1
LVEGEGVRQFRPSHFLWLIFFSKNINITEVFNDVQNSKRIYRITEISSNMSDLFNGYEADFNLAFADAQAKLEQTYGLQDENHRIELMKLIESSIDDCLDLLDSMTLEVQQIATNERSTYNAKVRSYKSDLDKIKKELKGLMDDKDRRQLFNGASDDEENFNQRQKLLNTNASIERSSQRIQEATRTALESESVGSSILNNLRSQRDQILNARDTLNEADTYVDRSLRTLKSMTRRMATNKLITYGIIAILILLILLVLYSKFS